MGEVLMRGVKEAPYLVRGRRVFIVVDSFGNMVRQLALKPGADPARVADFLEQWLDRTYPAPKLELVKPVPTKRVLRPARTLDPRLYSDPRSPLAKQRYLRALVRSAASQLPHTRPSDL